MHKLYDLREMLMDELEQITKRGQINEASLDVVQKLTHSIKSIDTILAMGQSSSESRESRESRDGYSGRRYRDGSRESRESSWDGGSSGRRRDSMGRFRDGGSSNDGYSGRRGYSRDEAKDKLVSGLEGMMDDVSPEAQHAISKAIQALERE